jgi:hypothetical protein
MLTAPPKAKELLGDKGYDADRTSRLSCGKAGKARIFTPVWDSSGEPRLSGLNGRKAWLVRIAP